MWREDVMRRLLSSLCLLAILIQAGAAPGLAATDPVAARAPAEVDRDVLASSTAGPVVTTGRMLDSRKRGTAGFVAALALPTEAVNRTLSVGDEVRTPTVGWARVGKDGAFKLKIDPKRLSREHREKGHMVNLLLIGWNDASLGRWAVTASTRPARGLKLPAARIRLDSSNDAATESRGPRPQPHYCARTLKSTYDAWSIIGETWPYGPHTGNITMKVGQTTSVGFASSGTGTPGTWTQRGSLDTSNSVEDDFNWLSGAFRDYRMQIRYGKFQSTCGYWYEERLFATGGFTNTSLDSRNFPTSWSHCAPAVGMWTRTTSGGYSYSLSGGVLIASIIGINLSLSSSYSEKRTMTYYYNGSYHVCGNNDVPSRASRIRTGA
jgi:hypothetical protein